MSASTNVHLCETDQWKAKFETGVTDHTWVSLDDADRRVSIIMHRSTPETFVTAIVGALPEPRRVALLKTLTAEWYAASAKAEGLAAPCSCLGPGPAGCTAHGIEDERFEETKP